MQQHTNDPLVIGGHTFASRFILGSGKYSLKLIQAAVQDAGAELITLAVRRANTRDQENILDYIPKGVTLLPNTSGGSERPGGGAHRPAGPGAGLRGLCENRDHAGQQVSPPRQRRDHPGHRDAGQGGVCGPALHVPPT